MLCRKGNAPGLLPVARDAYAGLTRNMRALCTAASVDVSQRTSREQRHECPATDTIGGVKFPHGTPGQISVVVVLVV